MLECQYARHLPCSCDSHVSDIARLSTSAPLHWLYSVGLYISAHQDGGFVVVQAGLERAQIQTQHRCT